MSLPPARLRIRAPSREWSSGWWSGVRRSSAIGYGRATNWARPHSVRSGGPAANPRLAQTQLFYALSTLPPAELEVIARGLGTTIRTMGLAADPPVMFFDGGRPGRGPFTHLGLDAPGENVPPDDRGRLQRPRWPRRRVSGGLSGTGQRRRRQRSAIGQANRHSRCERVVAPGFERPASLPGRLRRASTNCVADPPSGIPQSQRPTIILTISVRTHLVPW